MRSMQWQLGILGTISAFAYRHRETKKNLCRSFRSQDLPNTDLQPAVRHLKYLFNIVHIVHVLNTILLFTNCRALQCVSSLAFQFLPLCISVFISTEMHSNKNQYVSEETQHTARRLIKKIDSKINVSKKQPVNTYTNTVINTLSTEKYHHTVYSRIRTLIHLSKSLSAHKCIHEYINPLAPELFF